MQTVVVRRTGNARIRRAAINGVQLVWRTEDPGLSQPKELPAGERLFTWYVEGREGETYGFYFVEPEGVPCVVNPGPRDADGARDWGDCPFELI